MSDSLMPFQPAIDEPSNILPSLKKPSSTKRVGMDTCCSLPIVSVKRRSANLASLSLINFRTSAGVMCVLASDNHGSCSEADDHCSKLINAFQDKARLAVGEQLVDTLDLPDEGRLGGLVIAAFDAQLEIFDRVIAERERTFLQSLIDTRTGNEAFLVVQVLDPC